MKGFSAEVGFLGFKNPAGAVHKMYRTVIVFYYVVLSQNQDEAIFAINPAYRRVFFMP
jgi:hypothetical protein